MSLTIYLAGPEVFLPEGRVIIDQKREMVAEFGFTPMRRHAEFMKLEKLHHRALGEEISRLNEELMDEADLCIANLTPFRGVSADVGTVFELGYMVAQGKPAYGFTNDPRDYGARVVEEIYGSATRHNGKMTSPDGQVIENHGMSDNLMIDGAIARRGWSLLRAETMPTDRWEDLTVFCRVLAEARQQLLGSAA